jgi:predicted transcriptional regulator
MSTAATRHQQLLSLTTKKATTTQTFEDKVRQYAAFFDGSKKDFSEVEAIFDDLLHDDCMLTLSNGEELDKETRKELDKQRLAAGAKITNVAYTRIDYNKALIEFCVEESEDKNVIVQNLVTIKDKKIIEARQVDRLAGIIKACWLSDYHSLRRVQSYQHEGKVIFEGKTSPFADGNKVH